MNDLSRWVGADEHGGVPSQRRADTHPPAGWRLDAIAAAERIRSLAVSPDGTSLAYVHDREGSDIWVVELGSVTSWPRRLTTSRAPALYWEDTAVRWSPDGTRLALGDEGSVMVVPVAGGVPTILVEASDPVWVDDDTLLAVVERDRRSLIVRFSCHDAWPVPVARHPDGDAYGPVVSPDRRHVAYTVWRHDDLDRRELWIAPIEPGAGRGASRSGRVRISSPRTRTTPRHLVSSACRRPPAGDTRCSHRRRRASSRRLTPPRRRSCTRPPTGGRSTPSCTAHPEREAPEHSRCRRSCMPTADPHLLLVTNGTA